MHALVLLALLPIYERYCLPCHGEKGDGAGPAAPWLYPKPRDLTRGRMKWRSTPSGKPPADADLARVIRRGVPGTSMPAFEGILDDAQIAEAVRAVKAFAPDRFARPVKAIAPRAPARAPDPARGRELFGKLGCVQCHGAGGRGDGPAAAALKDERGKPNPPYDLTASPLRRADDGLAGLYLTLATGLDGTPMPAFSPAVPDADLWALAAFVESIRWKGTPPPGAGIVDTRAATPVSIGLTLEPQGTPPASLPPAAASLSSEQCGRCHARQLRQWRPTVHARAASPGLLGQLVGAGHGFVTGCLKCHAPLAEQAQAPLRAEGVTCAGCHLRGWTRHGPPRRPGLIDVPSYPFVEDAAWERSDFCLPCHQLAPGDLVEGRPLLDTYREWLMGPYMRRGIQCQHCHMPEREHTWKGVHDPQAVRQGVKTELAWTAAGVRAAVTNVGAAHYLPTTPTPAAWLEVELLDGAGKVLSSKRQRIGRHLVYQGGRFIEKADTRIPPGETLALTVPAVAGARRARVTLTMHPDDYYEGFYRQLLGKKLAPEARLKLEEALARASRSRFVVWREEISAPSASAPTSRSGG